MVIAADTIGMKILLAGNETDMTYDTDKAYCFATGNFSSLFGLSRCLETKFRAVSAEVSLTQLIKRTHYDYVVLMIAKTASKYYGTTCGDRNVWTLRSIHPYKTIFTKEREEWETSMCHYY